MDFKNCRYRIDKVPLSEACIDHFPDLKAAGDKLVGKGLPKNVDADKFLRYLILMFAPGSPYIEAAPSINHRKTLVCKEIEVKPKTNGEFETGWNEVLLLKDEEARKRMVYFLHLQYSELYSNLRVAEKDFYTLLEMDSPTDEAEVKNRALARAALVKEIETLKTKIVQGETSVLLANEIMKFVAQDNMGIRPEDYMELAPKPVLPENARVDAIFPEIPA